MESGRDRVFSAISARFVPHQSATAAFAFVQTKPGQSGNAPLFRNTVPGVKARWPTLAVTHCGCVASRQTGKLQVVQCSYFIVPSLSHDPTPTVTSGKKKNLEEQKPKHGRRKATILWVHIWFCFFFAPSHPRTKRLHPSRKSTTTSCVFHHEPSSPEVFPRFFIFFS